MRIPGLSLLAAAMMAAGFAAPRLAGAQVIDQTRSGEGRLRESNGRDYEFDRARLRLGQDGEFQLVMLGDSSYQLAGTWNGDLRFGPVSLELREAFGRKAQGTGRAWVRDRSWDRDRSFDRVELDGWNGDHEFALYFDTGTQKRADR